MGMGNPVHQNTPARIVLISHIPHVTVCHKPANTAFQPKQPVATGSSSSSFRRISGSAGGRGGRYDTFLAIHIFVTIVTKNTMKTIKRNTSNNFRPVTNFQILPQNPGFCHNLSQTVTICHNSLSQFVTALSY